MCSVMRMRRTLTLVLVVAAMTACGGDDSSDATCADTFAEGQVLSQSDAEDACTLPDGSTANATVSECVDGRMLITFDAAEPQLWGMVDEPMRTAESGTNLDDPAYVEMLDRC